MIIPLLHPHHVMRFPHKWISQNEMKSVKNVEDIIPAELTGCGAAWYQALRGTVFAFPTERSSKNISTFPFSFEQLSFKSLGGNLKPCSADETSIFSFSYFPCKRSFKVCGGIPTKLFVCLCFGFLWDDRAARSGEKRKSLNCIKCSFLRFTINNQPWDCIAPGYLNNCIWGFSKIHLWHKRRHQSSFMTTQ